MSASEALRRGRTLSRTVREAASRIGSRLNRLSEVLPEAEDAERVREIGEQLDVLENAATAFDRACDRLDLSADPPSVAPRGGWVGDEPGAWR